MKNAVEAIDLENYIARYISEGSKHSLKPVVAGGASCSKNADCGKMCTAP